MRFVKSKIMSIVAWVLLLSVTGYVLFFSPVEIDINLLKILVFIGLSSLAIYGTLMAYRPKLRTELYVRLGSIWAIGIVSLVVMESFGVIKYWPAITSAVVTSTVYWVYKLAIKSDGATTGKK